MAARIDEAPTVVPKMQKEQMWALWANLLRTPQVTAAALGELKDDHFIEPQWRVLWPIVRRLAEKRGVGRFAEEELYIELLDQLQLTQEGMLSTAQVSDLIGRPELAEAGVYPTVGVVYFAWHQAAAGMLDPGFGTDLLKRFLEERAVSDTVNRKFTLAGHVVPGDMDQFLSATLGKLTAIRHIGSRVVYDLSSDDIRPVKIDTRPTGVTFLDGHMDGGHAPGETYGVFGQEKGGKTQIVVQLVDAVADRAYAAELEGGDPLYAYLFVYEEEPKEIFNRFFACGCDIMRSRLNYAIESDGDFSTTGRLLPYERAMYKARGLDPDDPKVGLGELERLRFWKRTRSKYVRVVDMTGRNNPAVGGGGIPEVARFLHGEIAQGRRPGVVAIDYLNAAINRMMAAQELPDQEKRSRSIRFVVESSNMLASPFQVPVWILNQYDAQSQKKGAGTPMSSADGAEVKTLGANFNFIFALGKRDAETQVAMLTVDRARRSPSQGKHSLLRFDGDFARWEDVSGHFDVNESTGSITSKAQGAIASGLDAATKAALQQGPPPSDNPFAMEKEYAAGDAAGGDEDLY